jgi:ATP citrate (pro-S)-lyase
MNVKRIRIVGIESSFLLVGEFLSFAGMGFLCFRSHFDSQGRLPSRAMARKKIREFTAKSLLKKHCKSLPTSFEAVQATAETNWEALRMANPWINSARLVVKPDMLFGQRGKHDLVGLNLDIAGAEAFVKARLGKVITVGEGKGKPVTGAITHFIIERFVPHQEEYYVSFQSEREFTGVYLSAKGGVDIEENWEAVKNFRVEVGEPLVIPPEILADFPESSRKKITTFLVDSYGVFESLDFTMMEFNPFCVVPETGDVIPLDMRGELDDQAAFKNQKKWGDLEFPKVFGHQACEEEEFVASLDAQTGASLKLTILNPAGRIWLLVAGGGASVIYTDTVCDLGHSNILGNYGEYSGNPSDDHTYHYACTVLKAATRMDEVNPHKGRCLLIGGGIANFTDVKATFRGICKALLDHRDALINCGMKIFVRRGGPNFEAALKMVKDAEPGIGVPIDVFGPDTHMTKIVHLASDYIHSCDATH